MQAIILAAGMGKRLGDLTESNAKCMVKVNDVTLIERMLRQLDEHHFDKIIVVIGYEGEKLKSFINDLHISTPVNFVENQIFDKTNNIYSLYLAKEFLAEDDTLLFESDLIFEDNAINILLSSDYNNTALVAKYENWMDGTVVEIDEANRISNFIPKNLFCFQNRSKYYKTVNIYKFSKAFSISTYIPFLEAYCKAIGHNEYYEQVLSIIASLDKVDFKALPLENVRWYEIDDIQDLDIANTIFASEENQLPLYQKRYGGYWRFPDLLDYCYLVNPFFPPEKMKEEIKANFNVLLSEYPSGMGINSLLMAKNFSIRKEYVCVGNGAAELIKSLTNQLSGKVGIVTPTFDEYPNRIDTSLVEYFIPDNENFSYTSNDLINFFNTKDISSLVLINPDNPSGNFINKNDLLKVCTWAKDKKIKLIVDESFVDFTNEASLNSLLDNDLLESFPDLLVVKSISKSYGVPGIRLGLIASADTDLIRLIQKDVSIWNINSFAEFYMQIYSKYNNEYQVACENFRNERDLFFNELSEIRWLRVLPSQANYFLCELVNQYTSTELMRLLLIKHNIFIKDCSSKHGFNGRNYIRIAIRNRHDNLKFVKALKTLPR